MNKCKRCNVWVADDTMVCPLCHTILTEEKSLSEAAILYLKTRDAQ